ncbi:hypothetical protein DYB38_002652 [Aphanomyces astaci]|uniref:FYVE-type domain-containing protein n=1 Tax=Aphanomyces astaci TaxID=112090 RepID=A0A397DIN8_APHAT|nr:hypothetical protein DYB38_002652 [Aphanomyces astaci]
MSYRDHFAILTKMMCKFAKCPGPMTTSGRCVICAKPGHRACSTEYLNNFLVSPAVVDAIVCCSRQCADQFVVDKGDWTMRASTTVSLSADPDMSIPEDEAIYNYDDMLREHGLAPPSDDVQAANALVEQRFRTMSASSGRKRSDSSFSIASSMISRCAARWKKDKHCKECNTEFHLFLRRHHCRQCGFSFCAEHSGLRIALPLQGYKDPVRVCDDCFEYVNNSNEQLTFVCEDEVLEP